MNLKEYSRNIYSQNGEDGILEKVFEIIKPLDKWCVEFGAWDGVHLSNTANLIKNKKWNSILIEASKYRYQDLVKEYHDNRKVLTFNKFVSFEGENSLDSILKTTPIPKDFDLLSIDIDGNDYHIFDSLKIYSPKVIIIEFNPTIPANIEFIQSKNNAVTQGSSLLSITNLANSKGYELIAVTEVNAIIVKRDYFNLFDIKNNLPQLLKSKKMESQIFQLYDGTIVLQGEKTLLWHKVKINETRLQVIPKIWRKFPDNLDVINRMFFNFWRRIHNHFSWKVFRYDQS